MEFLTIEASDYESALRQARNEYGQAVRIHTRKDFQRGGLLHPKKACKITFYLVEHKPEVPEKEPEIVQEVGEPVFERDTYLASLLVANAIPLEAVDEIRTLLLEQELESAAEIEVRLLEYLFEDIVFDAEPAAKYLFCVGTAGVGKTKTAIKMALHVNAAFDKKVALLTLSSSPGESSTLGVELAKQFSLDVYEANLLDGEKLQADLSIYDHVLVDMCGFSSRDEGELQALEQWYSFFGADSCVAYLIVSASAKLKDLQIQEQWYEHVDLKAVVVTKLDETDAIGNILIFLRQSRLSLAYLSNGPLIPHDFLVADASILMSFLNGFSLDLSQFFPSLE